MGVEHGGATASPNEFASVSGQGHLASKPVASCSQDWEMLSKVRGTSNLHRLLAKRLQPGLRSLEADSSLSRTRSRAGRLGHSLVGRRCFSGEGKPPKGFENFYKNKGKPKESQKTESSKSEAPKETPKEKEGAKEAESNKSQSSESNSAAPQFPSYLHRCRHMYTYMHAYVSFVIPSASVHATLHVYMHTCKHTCEHGCIRACMHTNIHANMHAYILKHMQFLGLIHVHVICVHRYIHMMWV